MKTWGHQSRIARKTGISQPSINAIFRGKRRATPKQAEKLENEFLKEGIPLNRWDLLYEIKVGQTLEDYLSSKNTNKEINR